MFTKLIAFLILLGLAIPIQGFPTSEPSEGLVMVQFNVSGSAPYLSIFSTPENTTSAINFWNWKDDWKKPDLSKLPELQKACDEQGGKMIGTECWVGRKRDTAALALPDPKECKKMGGDWVKGDCRIYIDPPREGEKVGDMCIRVSGAMVEGNCFTSRRNLERFRGCRQKKKSCCDAMKWLGLPLESCCQQTCIFSD